MMPRFTVKMSEAEIEALKKLAASEIRDFRNQARLIIKEDLIRRGLLETDGAQSIKEGNSKDGRG